MNPNDILGALGAGLGGINMGTHTYWQNQQQNMQNMLGNHLGFVPMQLGVQTRIVRCAYCGKRPKAENDDRCDGCGAPR